MDDIAEQHDIANEISNAISSPVGFGEDIDEDELNKELEELEEEELDKVRNINIFCAVVFGTLYVKVIIIPFFRILFMCLDLPSYQIFPMSKKWKRKKSKNQQVS